MKLIETKVLSPFDEALARQEQPLLSMEEKKECCEGIWAHSRSSLSFSSFIRPWRSSGWKETTPNTWSTHYRNGTLDDGWHSKFTHTIEFTESNATTHFEYDNKEDEEQSFSNVFSFDYQEPSTPSTLPRRMYFVRVAMVTTGTLAGVLLLRLIA